MIGGAERVMGPVVGAIIVVLLPEALSFLAQYRLLFVGLLLLVVLLLAPGGFVGLIGRFCAEAARSAPRRPSGRRGASRAPAARERLSVERAVGQFRRRARGDAAVGFEARPGAITSIIGPNGAGKSTVLNLDRRLLPGRPRHRAARRARHRRPAVEPRSRVPGSRAPIRPTQLFAHMAVIDNVLVALRRGRLGVAALFAPDRDARARALAESLLAFVGYRGPLDALAGALPHVDKRLVEIARALAHPARACCCSTSPPPGSTRPTPSGSASCCAGSPRSASW